MILLKNGLVSDGESLVKKDVLIDGRYVVDVAENISADADVFDVNRCWVIPGAVDAHAHFREPGFTHKGTIRSESLSAAAGGITTAFAMPNLNPVPDCMENLKIEQDIILSDSAIKIYPYASVTKGERGEVCSDYDGMKGQFVALSDDGVCVKNPKILKKAMLWAKKNGVVIASHAECDGFSDDPEAEYIAVEREIKLVGETGCRYHFCHLSTERALNAVRKAKAAGADITCEVTPHHITLCRDDIKNNPNFKMNPPLRSRADMSAALSALLDGTADMIATDHAPHAEYEKAVPYVNAPNGVIGFETLLPVVYTYLIKTKLASHKRFLEWLVYNPASRFSVPCGKIAKGGVADIAVLDIESRRAYTESDIVSAARNSPFVGEELYGFNLLTLINGDVAYIRRARKQTEEICSTDF